MNSTEEAGPRITKHRILAINWGEVEKIGIHNVALAIGIDVDKKRISLSMRDV